jgi:hypothetical protein
MRASRTNCDGEGQPDPNAVAASMTEILRQAEDGSIDLARASRAYLIGAADALREVGSYRKRPFTVGSSGEQDEEDSCRT